MKVLIGRRQAKAIQVATPSQRRCVRLGGSLRTLWVRALVRLSFVALGSSCGPQSHSTGSNTNWVTCSTNAHCADLAQKSECVQGVCTAIEAPTDEPTPSSSELDADGAAPRDFVFPVDDADALQRRLALSRGASCVVNKGKVFCWGSNTWGQLGTDPALESATPRVIEGVSDAIGVAVSDAHVCANTAQGEVYCWGANDVGQSGDAVMPPSTCTGSGAHADPDTGDVPCQPTPTRVPQVEGAVAVAVNEYQSCARLLDGTVRCWGDIDALASWSAAVKDATSLALSAFGGCATDRGGIATCSYSLPEDDGSLGPLKRLALSTSTVDTPEARFSCGLDAEDKVRCFGAGDFGQLGAGSRTQFGSAQPELPSLGQQLALGARHACVLDSLGQVYCWGNNNAGQLGRVPLASPNCGSETCETLPRRVEGLPGPMVAITATLQGTCALSEEGSLWCWGAVPLRIPGPWESDDDTCLTSLEGVFVARNAALYELDTSCTSDEDCFRMPLDLSCDHTCAEAVVGRSRSTELQTLMASAQDEYCAAANSAGCPAPSVECPDQELRLVCVSGTCMLDDPQRTECDDPCLCDAQRTSALLDEPNERSTCAGHNVHLELVSVCWQCEDSQVYLSLVNDGDEAFEGTVNVQFLPTIEQDDVPDDFSLELQLDAHRAAEPIAVKSVAGGEVYVAVFTADDCDTSDDEVLFTMPKPTNSCQ